MPSDPFAMLQQDHREVERLLTSLADSEPGAERQQLVTQLTEALRVHMQFEEQDIYPKVGEVMGSETEEEAEVEHRLAREGDHQAVRAGGRARIRCRGGDGHGRHQ